MPDSWKMCVIVLPVRVNLMILTKLLTEHPAVCSIEDQSLKDRDTLGKSNNVLSSSKKWGVLYERFVAITIASNDSLPIKGHHSKRGCAWEQLEQFVELLLLEQKDYPSVTEKGYPRDPFLVTFWREQCVSRY
jgi:hypothetical protein